MNGYNTQDLARLEPDYLERFALLEAPFSVQHEDKFLYIDAERAQSLNLLQHLTHYSNLLLIVQGDQGVGKSAIKQRFIKNAEPDWQICEVNANTMMDAEQLLFQAAQGFGVTQLPEDAGQLQEMLYARIATLHHNERVPILIIDDAHLLPKDALLAIFNLADAYVNDVNLLRIILFCEPVIEKIINSKEVRPLRERVTHTTEITSFDEATTADYLKHRMAVAGFNGSSPFTPKMIKQIQRASHGVPAKINELAHQMLQEGDTAQIEEMPQTAPTIHRQARNHTPIVFASIAVIVIALVLVFQETINRLFEENPEPSNKQTETTATPEKSSEQVLAEQSIQEKIIPLHEPPVTESPPVQTVPEPESTSPAVSDTQTEAVTNVPVENAKATAVTPTNEPPPVEVVPLQLYAVSPDPVPASEERQTLNLSGQGFTPESEVMVSWGGKQKRLSADQVNIKSEAQIDINITVGTNEDHWNVRVLDPKAGKSNLLAFDVKHVLTDRGNQRDRWVIDQNPENFTLQLFATHEKQNADGFIKQHQLSGDVAYFESIRNNKSWYSVVYGSYADQAAAKAAVQDLPASMKKIKPWVRRFDDIQASINASRKLVKKKSSKLVTQPVSGEKPSTNTPASADESWIWSQDPSNYTLQLLGARQTDSVQQFLRKYSSLNGKAVYFHTRHDSRDWYAVVYGVYTSREQAQQAIKRLPPELQSDSPWIRSFASIHAELDRTDQ